jgi:hypothetical protein
MTHIADINDTADLVRAGYVVTQCLSRFVVRSTYQDLPVVVMAQMGKSASISTISLQEAPQRQCGASHASPQEARSLPHLAPNLQKVSFNSSQQGCSIVKAAERQNHNRSFRPRCGACGSLHKHLDDVVCILEALSVS